MKNKQIQYTPLKFQHQHVAVTGASSGIGLSICQQLAPQCSKLSMIARPSQHFEDAYRQIAQNCPQTSIQAFRTDLSQLKEVRDLSQQLICQPPDVLILNAASTSKERTRTSEQIETTFAVNHLSSFLLLHTIIPHLPRPCKIIFLAASPFFLQFFPVKLDDLQCSKGYSAIKAYLRTKSMNVMLMKALSDQYPADIIRIHAVHPGAIRTSIGQHLSGLAIRCFNLIRPYLTPPEQGADTVVWLAQTQDTSSFHGQLLYNRKALWLPEHIQNKQRQLKLLEESEQLLHNHFHHRTSTAQIQYNTVTYE